MGTVIKKGGRKQLFNATKLRRSILKAAKEAKLSKAKANELIKQVAEPVIALYKKKKVKTADLRKALLGRLNRRAKKVSSAWKRYDRARKKK